MTPEQVNKAIEDGFIKIGSIVNTTDSDWATKEKQVPVKVTSFYQLRSGHSTPCTHTT